MWPSSPSSWFRPVFVQFLLHFLLLVFPDTAETRNSALQSPVNGSIPAVFVFGDSTVDSGNNNYIKTISKSNFPPYGKDFPNHIPTGRFTNGKLVTDFLVSYMGIKDYVPPYLDPTLSLDELKTGVCFASAGTGFDPLTAQISDGVIPIQKQLKYFKEYKSRMELYIGKERTKSLMSKAVFLISAGTNDFILNYYGLPIRSQTYTISTYQDFILQLAQQFIQGLLKLGARKIAIVGLPPIGCVPAVITLYSNNALSHRVCIERLSSIARDYNRLLQNKLTNVQTHGTKIIYVDIYKPIEDIIKRPQQFGFEKVDCGCCGSGLLEASVLCNSYSLVCSDDSKYVFWDAVHPTEAAYYTIFQAVRPVLNQFLKEY
ncbi:GDSL esterase/lipase at5g45960 [Phtheirospermum japonicum]|uniref:GDSL esterase/lipase at5g45960 n=1 Tax=Phtheirospermum japonicum TaxID=374723 RepID=A0A830CMU9_9LAMI|nr:GDSL esterase/lipase at5g45960 [Phtheirospermum japonicum]